MHQPDARHFSLFLCFNLSIYEEKQGYTECIFGSKLIGFFLSLYPIFLYIHNIYFLTYYFIYS